MRSLVVLLREGLPTVQLFRYGLVGLLSNATAYLAYLSLTALGSTPKLTMTLLYVVGALIGFFANRRFTFGYEGHIGIAGVRFVVAHIFGYLLNFLLLFLFVDCLGFAHYLVQACAIVVVAIFLFIMFRVFIFAQIPAREGAIRS